jgi:hypothetical protein
MGPTLVNQSVNNDKNDQVADAMHPSTNTPTQAALSSNPEIQLRLNELLGDASPDDWHDAHMVALRTCALEATARDAAEGMAELLVRLNDERSRGEHLGETGCVYHCVDTTHRLHRALVAYRHDTLRHDGEEIAYNTVTQSHGRGVAALTMRALAELRLLITREMQSLP